MLAGFKSFWVACFTGLAIGVAQSELVNLQANHPSLPQGMEAVAPLIVIIVVAFVRGHTTLRRDDPAQDRLPRSPNPTRPGRTAILCLIGGAIALSLTSGDVRLGLIVSLISAVVCLSMVLITGYVGHVSLMQLTFAGMGGLLVAALAAKAGMPFPLAPLVALVGAGMLGLLVGVPALRVRGTSLAVVTLSAAVVSEQLIFPSSILSGGIQGNAVRAPTILGVNFSILSGAYPGLPFGLLVLALAALAATGVANLRRSPSGVRMLAIRANERAAASLGINLAQTKLVAFTLAALLAGLAGVLFAYQQVRLSAGSFGVFPSLLFLAFAYLGGITSVSGAMIAGLLIPGGLALTLLDKLGNVGQYQSVAAGVLVMAIAVVRPDGLAGLLTTARTRRHRPPTEVKPRIEERCATSEHEAVDSDARLAEVNKK
jgi:branched-chain amino acid transport system permease protein